MISTDFDLPDGAISLYPREELYVDPGKMQAYKNVTMVTEVSTGIFESLKRYVFGGPNIFNNKFQAGEKRGWILIEENIPGQLQQIELTRPETFRFRSDSWVASSPNLELQTVYQGILGHFQGTGITMLETAFKGEEQRGKLFFACDRGVVKKIQVRSHEGPVTIDNDSILGYTGGLSCSIRLAGSGPTSLFFGNEGLVCDFQGDGTVYIASTPQIKPDPNGNDSSKQKKEG